MTFAHPHGDVFQQAEWVANAVARIKERTGAAHVDLVAHSKGGLSLAVYLSNTTDADWDNAAYETVGTPYRGDVRRAVRRACPRGPRRAGARAGQPFGYLAAIRPSRRSPSWSAKSWRRNRSRLR